MNCEKCGNKIETKVIIHDEKWVLFGITLFHRTETYDTEDPSIHIDRVIKE